jgi:hypothetical protein
MDLRRRGGVQPAAGQGLYGDTHARGWQGFHADVLAAAERLEGRAGSAGTMQQLREAALADEHTVAPLDRALAELDRAVV